MFDFLKTKKRIALLEYEIENLKKQIENKPIAPMPRVINETRPQLSFEDLKKECENYKYKH